MSAEELLKKAGELSLLELDRLATEIINLRAQRAAPSLPAREAELLGKINRGVPAALQKRCEELIEKRDTETLITDEHEELKRLTLQIELIEADRIRHLTELAKLRRKTLAALMESLGLRAPEYA